MGIGGRVVGFRSVVIAAAYDGTFSNGTRWSRWVLARGWLGGLRGRGEYTGCRCCWARSSNWACFFHLFREIREIEDAYGSEFTRCRIVDIGLLFFQLRFLDAQV